MLCVTFKMATFPWSCQKQKTFLCLHYENLVGLLEIKLTKVEVGPGVGPLGVFLTLKLVHTESPAVHQLQLSYLNTGSHGGLCSSKCDSLYPPLCVSSFGGCGLPCDLNSLMDLRKVVNLQLSFLLVRTECWCPNSLHSRPETEVQTIRNK